MGTNNIKNILLLDTTFDKTTIGFFDGKKLHMKIVKKENSHKLHLEIGKLVGNWKLKIGNLEAIGLVNGPGSFTGIRTGIAIANALAYALKIPIYTTDSLTAQGVINGVATLPANKDEVYFAQFKNSKMVREIKIVETRYIVSLPAKQCLKNVLKLVLSGELQPQTQILPIYIKKPNINITKPKR